MRRGSETGDQNIYGTVHILGEEKSYIEKQIPHPAKTAGIRDDTRAAFRCARVSTELEGF